MRQSGCAGAAPLQRIDEDWREAICAGTPPFERLRHAAFRTRRSSKGTEAAGAWLDALRPGPGGEQDALEVLGLDQVSLKQAFGPATVAPDCVALPEWTDCLVRAVSKLPSDSPPAHAAEDSVDIGTPAFLEAAMDLLDWSTLAGDPDLLDPVLIVGLARQMTTRLLLACGATLELESLGRPEPVWDFARSAWIDRLCGFPGLNFVIGTAIRQWRQNALELLRRVRSDRPVLEDRLFDGARVGPLVAIDADLGDRHHDGRSVATLTFASGHRVVYKPKDLGCSAWLMSVIALLNRAQPRDELPTYRIIQRGRYGWEEHVEQHETTTAPAARRFFRRFGALLRVLQLVEARDFWIDNLRIGDGEPVFVDLECILQPRLAGEGFQTSGPHVDADLYQESVLPTGAVTQTIDVPGVGKQDFGALSSVGSRVLPLGLWSGYRDRTNGNISLRDGRLYWAPDVAWPLCNGRPARAQDHLDDLESGYRELQRLLLGCVPALREGVPAIADRRVRVLMRSTWEYLVLLRVSVEPSALLSGNAREVALAGVLATAHRWGDTSDVRRRLTIARHELDALRRLDIPVFFSVPSGNAVTDADGASVPDVFSGVAIERYERRLQDAASFDVDLHLEVLRFAVRSMRAGADAQLPSR